MDVQDYLANLTYLSTSGYNQQRLLHGNRKKVNLIRGRDDSGTKALNTLLSTIELRMLGR